MKKQI